MIGWTKKVNQSDTLTLIGQIIPDQVQSTGKAYQCLLGGEAKFFVRDIELSTKVKKFLK